MLVTSFENSSQIVEETNENSGNKIICNKELSCCVDGPAKSIEMFFHEFKIGHTIAVIYSINDPENWFHSFTAGFANRSKRIFKISMSMRYLDMDRNDE